MFAIGKWDKYRYAMVGVVSTIDLQVIIISKKVISFGYIPIKEGVEKVTGEHMYPKCDVCGMQFMKN